MHPIPEGWAAAAQAAQRRWRVPASVSLAQAILETGWGVHAPHGNLFGTKPRAGKHDACYTLSTREWDAGQRRYNTVDQPFRAFASVAEAFDAHGELLATAPVYRPAMAALPDLGRFIDRMAVHYATEPTYAARVKALVMGGLARFDQP